jgi:hypothetical protein
MAEPTKPVLRLPKKLAYATLHCAFLGVVACSGHDEPSADASTDVQGYDSPGACDGGPANLCGSGPCPEQGAYYCTIECPPGCAPFS